MERIFDDAIVFDWSFNPETSLYEVAGRGAYRNILAYGDTPEHAISILEQEILPTLWEDFSDDDARLTREAQEIKNDLVARTLP